MTENRAQFLVLKRIQWSHIWNGVSDFGVRTSAFGF
jgi:hypothetical protein